MPAVFNNRTVQVLQQINRTTAKAARAMAEDVVRVSNPKTPHSGSKGGGLRSRRRIEQKNLTSYDIHWSVPYAEYQNRGSRRDGSHRVRNYTTPGTGKGFIDAGLNYVKKTYKGYFK